MGFLFGFFIILYVLVCIGLIFLVLIQSDKGGGMSGALGGGFAGANTLLGTQDTANILTKGTTIFASSYMIICIILSLVLSHWTHGEKSLLKQRAQAQEQSFSPSSILGNQGTANGSMDPLQQPVGAQDGQATIPPTPISPAPAPAPGGK